MGWPAKPIALAPEPGKPDAGLLPCAAALQADGGGLQADAEDLADPLEILVDRVPPSVVGAEFTKPAAGEIIDRAAPSRVASWSERVLQRHAGGAEIIDVAGDDGRAFGKRRRCDHQVGTAVADVLR